MWRLLQLLGNFRPDNGVKTATMLQLSATECGIISLAIIFAYYGVHLSIDSLREQCGTSRDGAKASTLVNVAEQYHFDAGAYRVELEDIKQLAQPVIAFWKFNHYVVIEGVGRDRVYLNDPACGRLTVNFDEFDKFFTGVIIAITPTPETVRVKKCRQFLPMMAEWLARYKIELLFVVACMALAGSVPLLNAKLSSIFIDYVIVGRNLNMIPSIAMALLAASIVLTLALRNQKLAQFRLTTKASMMKSAEIIQHMLKLPLLFYSLRQKTEIAAILIRSEAMANIIFKSMAALLMSVVTSLLCLMFLIKIDCVLVVPLLSLSLLLLASIVTCSNVNYAYEQTNANTLGKFYGLTLSSIKNIETIKTCGIEATIFGKWHASLCAKIQAQDKTNTMNVLIDCFYQSFNSITMLATFTIGIFRIADSQLSVGGLMAFYALQLYFCGQLTTVLSACKDAQNAFASHARISDILQQNIDPRFLPAADATLTTTTCLLSCRNIYFYYNKNAAPTLSDISLDIQPGQHIAFIGGTGSGKSTLVKILSHLQPASSGSLKLRGYSIEQYSAEQLAKEFAYVSQDVTLFTGTIYSNLTMWRSDIPEAVIESALQDACLTELIKVRGLHGKVEEGGSNFSGGERQRIDIARALIQGASILVLDEATSALDVATEANLIASLRRRNITIIFVAHRLSTIQHCDQIYVIDNGQIVESGCHQQLIASQGFYHRLLLSESGH